MVTWLCSLEGYLEGGGISVRLWKAIRLNVSFDCKRIHGYYTITVTVCQQEKNHPISFVNHVNILFFFSDICLLYA